MRTNIDIDEDLMREAMDALGSSTKREAVETALRWMVRIGMQKKALDALRGMGWEGDLDAMRTDKPLPGWD